MKYSEEHYEELLKKEGIIQQTIVVDGQVFPHWDNTGLGTDFSRFWCYICLKDYTTMEQRDVCSHSHTPEEEANPKQMER